MPPNSFAKIVLAQRPSDIITPSTFREEYVPFNLQAKDSQVVIRVNWTSVDPAMRGWINDTRSYIRPIRVGEVMRAQGLGTVIQCGRNSCFSAGDLVRGMLGWTEYAVMYDKDLEKITDAETLSVHGSVEVLDYLGPLGGTGLTAYFGLLDIGKIKKDETLVVSGAAGAVGSIVCQIGKIKGAKVIAIAGSEEKCAWLKDDIGVDLVFNYKSHTFQKDFKNEVGYLDVYFDNVGGAMLDFMLTRLKVNARVVLCGAISAYNSKTPRGLSAYLNLISMRATMQGFVVLDYTEKFPSASAEIAKWIKEGKIKQRYFVVNGLSRAPEVLRLLFEGVNTGKTVVRVWEEGKSRL